MQLDFRSKGTVFLCTVFLASTLSKDTLFYLLSAILCLYVVISGYSKSVIKFIIPIAVVGSLRYISKGTGFGVMLPDMFLFIVLRMLSVVLSALPIIKTPPGELMAVMRKLKIPGTISLPLLFMMRFLPVVKSEFKEIIDSLLLRNLLSFKKPLITMEYVFVPMMFSASNIAEELAAAAEVRGISAEGIHTSRREIKFRKIDCIIVISSLLITAGLYYLEGATIV